MPWPLQAAISSSPVCCAAPKAVGWGGVRCTLRLVVGDWRPGNISGNFGNISEIFPRGWKDLETLEMLMKINAERSIYIQCAAACGSAPAPLMWFELIFLRFHQTRGQFHVFLFLRLDVAITRMSTLCMDVVPIVASFAQLCLVQYHL